MADRLVKIRPVSGATSTPDAGDGMAQKVYIPVNGLTDGAGICVVGESVYITDYDKHVIYRYRRGDQTSKIFAGSYDSAGLADGHAGAAQFNGPSAICADKSGNLWVVDAGNERIRRVDGNGNVFTVAAIPAEAGSNFTGGIAIDDAGNIFLIDQN